MQPVLVRSQGGQQSMMMVPQPGAGGGGMARAGEATGAVLRKTGTQLKTFGQNVVKSMYGEDPAAPPQGAPARPRAARPGLARARSGDSLKGRHYAGVRGESEERAARRDPYEVDRRARSPGGYRDQDYDRRGQSLDTGGGQRRGNDRMDQSPSGGRGGSGGGSGGYGRGPAPRDMRDGGRDDRYGGYGQDRSPPRPRAVRPPVTRGSSVDGGFSRPGDRGGGDRGGYDRGYSSRDGAQRGASREPPAGRGGVDDRGGDRGGSSRQGVRYDEDRYSESGRGGRDGGRDDRRGRGGTGGANDSYTSLDDEDLGERRGGHGGDRGSSSNPKAREPAGIRKDASRRKVGSGKGEAITVGVRIRPLVAEAWESDMHGDGVLTEAFYAELDRTVHAM